MFGDSIGWIARKQRTANRAEPQLLGVQVASENGDMTAYALEKCGNP